MLAQELHSLSAFHSTINSIAKISVDASAPMMQPRWYCCSRLLHIFEYFRAPRKSFPGDAFGMDFDELGSHDAAMLVPFLEIFAYFWMFFELRSHFGSVL